MQCFLTRYVYNVTFSFAVKDIVVIFSQQLFECVFCVRSKGAREDDGDLRQVSRFETDANIRTIITELNDFRILVRIIGGDLIAIGAKYHLKCLI